MSMLFDGLESRKEFKNTKRAAGNGTDQTTDLLRQCRFRQSDKGPSY